MNINHHLKAIFIHNPKAAGTSMAIALGMDHGHDTQDEARQRHGECWGDYFKFAFVRAPMDRLISTYEFAKMSHSFYHNNQAPGPAGSHGDAHRDHGSVQGKSLDDCLRMLLDDPSSLSHPGWLPQSHFISNPDGLDFVGRFESLEEGWQAVESAIGGSFPLDKINPTTRGDIRDYYTPFACAAAARLYKLDFHLFGYALPIPLVNGSFPRPAPAPAPASTVAKIAHGAIGLAKAALGVDRASDEVIAARLATCESCEFWEKLTVGHRCNKCGCSGLKLNIASEACPIGKWTKATSVK